MHVAEGKETEQNLKRLVNKVHRRHTKLTRTQRHARDAFHEWWVRWSLDHEVYWLREINRLLDLKSPVDMTPGWSEVKPTFVALVDIKQIDGKVRRRFTLHFAVENFKVHIQADSSPDTPIVRGDVWEVWYDI